MSNSSECKTWPFQLSVCPIVDIIIQLADPISDSKLEPPDKKCPRAQDLMLIHFKFEYLANLSSEKSISTTFFQKWISGHNFWLGQRLWATFLMLFSEIPHLAMFLARSQIAK